jgi:hypothetical protein
MVPPEHDATATGKLLEGLYAIDCGLAVFAIAGIIFAPGVHRFLPKLHAEREHL